MVVLAARSATSAGRGAEVVVGATVVAGRVVVGNVDGSASSNAGPDEHPALSTSTNPTSL
jgi:hypothetical protein